MDDKLQELVANKEYYSAHQLLLSLAQRHRRAGRHLKAFEVLSGGISAMFKPDCDHATLADLARKQVEIVEELAKSEIPQSVDEGIRLVFQHLVDCQMWQEYSEGVAKVVSRTKWKSLSLEFLRILLREETPVDKVAEWAVHDCSKNAELFRELGARCGSDLVAECVVQLLCLRSFGSAAALLKEFLEKAKAQHVVFNIDDTLGSLPSFLALMPEAAEMELINFVQLLFVLCQRANPSIDLYNQLESRYASLLSEREKLQTHLADLKALYWPPKRSSQIPGNPLAAMFQSMLAGNESLPRSKPKKNMDCLD